MINKIRGLYEIGGLNLLLFKAEDKLFHGHNGRDYMQKVFEAAEPEEYPQLLKSMWKMHFDEPLDLENPKSFNEKIQWMKLHDTTPQKARLADKYLVRDWIKEKIGEQYLVPLLSVWDSFDEIDFSTLPDTFVLKCNHGSGMNMVVKNKAMLDIKSAKSQFDEWMKSDFTFLNGFEMQYKPEIG